MILVADCGATKGDWMLADGRATKKLVHTRGFNPVVHPPELLDEELEKLASVLLPGAHPDHIHYYGAGCWDGRRKAVVEDGLRKYWPAAQTEVLHDLLGAARAACGKAPGIACILGTGSNTCLYDGNDVIDNVTNLGYLLGDEGSGAYFGKEFLRAYFYRELDPELKAAFEAQTTIDRPTLLDLVYESETPNVYLATFTRFLGEHREHPFVQRMLYNGFAEFIDRHVRKYHGHLSLPVSFIGSIAFHFQPILRAVLAERGMHVGHFVPKPIDALVDFHLG